MNKKKLHILGISGTFMGGIAVLAQQLGYQVTGTDRDVYPPMSDQLAANQIEVSSTFSLTQFTKPPESVLIGNVMSRGHAPVEAVLNAGWHYTSGPAWLAEEVLRDRWVLAVSGTHGKTTTASMLAWILEYAGLAPGFLIGGMPHNFLVSARLGQGRYFVVEADEYDSAFFDKRAKFMHYRPRTLVIQGIEFDHADIFDNLAAIQQQFHHLVRTVPPNGRIIYPEANGAVQTVLAKGCWSEEDPVAGVVSGGASHQAWSAQVSDQAGQSFSVWHQGKHGGDVVWPLFGRYNINNALAAMAAANHVGVPVSTAVAALAQFQGVARRMEVRGVVNDITVYDDFAHHPTAISEALVGLRRRVGQARIVAVLEWSSYTMRTGVHKLTAFAEALMVADEVVLLVPQNEMGQHKAKALSERCRQLTLFSEVSMIINVVATESSPGDHIVIMSNSAFENIHARLLSALEKRER